MVMEGVSLYALRRIGRCRGVPCGRPSEPVGSDPTRATTRVAPTTKLTCGGRDE